MESVISMRGCCESLPWGGMCGWMLVFLRDHRPSARGSRFIYSVEEIFCLQGGRSRDFYGKRH